MSKNDSSYIDMVADLVGSDTCQYLWVIRVLTQEQGDILDRLLCESLGLLLLNRLITKSVIKNIFL